MDLLLIKEGFPLLSFLIFLPLAGATVLLFFHGASFARDMGAVRHLADRHLLCPIAHRL
jgi:hypothetical protein